MFAGHRLLQHIHHNHALVAIMMVLFTMMMIMAFTIHSCAMTIQQHALDRPHVWSDHDATTSLTSLSKGWCIQNRNKSIHECQVEIPAYVNTILFQRNIIGDPYFRFNDVLQRWIAYEDWTFRNEFITSVNNGDRVYLQFKGLDTVCDIFLNDQWIGSNVNMFHELVVDVTSFIRSMSNNVLVLNFQSPVKYVKNQAAKSLYPIPSSDNEEVQHGEVFRNFIRKTQSSFSWDWGPCFVPTGIWKNVNLITISNAFNLKDILVEIFPTSDLEVELKKSMPTSSSKNLKPLLTSNFVVNSTFLVDVITPNIAVLSNVKLSVSIEKDEQVACTTSQVISLMSPGPNKLTLSLQCNQVQLWYPVGYGSQPLYSVHASVTTQSAATSTLSKRIGFREFKIIQKSIGKDDPVNNPSKSFYFQVNGIPIFAKGSNYIPPDSFLDRVKDQDIFNVLDSFLESNQNTLRIWGGGNFERDALYDYCDEKGILVWQEFMFACSVYPRDDAFLSSVRTEIEQQVTRLMHHPSIILWSGSNENEASLWGDTWYGPIISSSNKMRYIVDYGVLYFDTVRETLLSVDRSRNFWPSSPSKGVISENPYVGYWTNPYGTQLGDVHYYDYSTICTNVDNFPRARFMSEYGHQSFASLETFKPVTQPQDWFFNSTLMNHRQHHPLGTEQILFQIGVHFKANMNNLYGNFKNFVYLSQCSQALCMKAQSEYYRAMRDDTNVQTHGALYWQLNSIWQTVDWASLEYGGKWKVMHYFVKEFFAQTIILSYEQGGWFKVVVTSDSLMQQSLTATINFVTYSDGYIKQSIRIPNIVVAPLSGTMIFVKMTELVILESFCFLAHNCFVHMNLQDSVTNRTIAENVHFLSPLAQVDLPQSNVKITGATFVNSNTVEVTVLSDNVAFYVWFDVLKYQGRFDRNAITLLKGREEKIRFTSKSPIQNLNDFISDISIIHIRNTY
ncbi:hypothetical protein C9374_003851 [Naegleria lovaniensis]|uniref:Beta-mannosidase B n=1 Tax=Naegleria lovaniensis TaxID=51637 RepID=A0AA88KSD7_NAELO|nr:uncharacterized protein C9374_003851 [Naegleria lovaniensis]KAG2394087.1 hypothetical protein C9374_003851 [Naegleria lovaniensis]